MHKVFGLLRFWAFAPLFLSAFLTCPLQSKSQDTVTLPIIDYDHQLQFEIGGIDLGGTQFLDKGVLTLLSGLYVGQKIKIPGEEISQAIDNLWKQNLFENVKILLTRVEATKVYLEIYVEEKPRLSVFSIKGLRKSESKTLREDELGFLRSGIIVNDNLINKTRNEVLAYFKKKGFMLTDVKIEATSDPVKKNYSSMRISISKGRRIRVNDIIFTGNLNVSAGKLRRSFKETNRRSLLFFKSSKFIAAEYDAEKSRVLYPYMALGFRDARIVSDTVYSYAERLVNIHIHIDEGHKYYFRNIKWSGNTKFRQSYMDSALSIKKGDVYDQSVLDSRLNGNPQGFDVASLYMDDGYLFFQVQPVEVLVENDSIDIEIRMMEGPQAIINNIIIKGNTKTSDHVILRELHTRPGDKFSRSDVTRSIRELSQLGLFDPEQLGVNPIPNMANGTVDIEYKVEEKPSDQIELSGGYGGVGGVVGVLGLTLNNFSARKMFKRKEWSPMPSGDGQRLSVRAQSNGQTWQSYNFSFTEPWLGGRKPQSFSVSTFHSIQSMDGLRAMKSDTTTRWLKTTGLTLSLGKRLKKPDDFFVFQNQLSFQRYNNQNFPLSNGGQSLATGKYNDLYYRGILSRNSVSDPIFPRSGSNITLSLQMTVPYSSFTNKNYKDLPEAERMKWLEYYKMKFDVQWFNTLLDKLVLATRLNFGYMSAYNQQKGTPSFNRFVLGGNGLTGFNLDGREVISQRGYDDGTMSRLDGTTGLSNIYSRYTAELRYPLSLNQSATIYILGFGEAGRGWSSIKNYNPFNVYRAAGVGVRIFLPMFGLLGFDYAYGFDGTSSGWRPHFFLGQQF